jgi:HD-GYP domain-containing protein (c-di-GMP phosphodiesterase class II)
MTREELIRAADQAAYAAKHMGKGRVGRPEDAAFTLDRDPARLTAQMQQANLATVAALAAAVVAKDPYTRGHSQRVSAYAGVLAGFMQRTPDEIARVELAGLLHDVGKIGVPDAILAKPSKLSAQEYVVIRQHAVIGERMLSSVPFLLDVLPAVRHHHERWDGAGYPDALQAEAIPLDAAILMVADSLDAMTSSRTYRPALPLDEARRRILEGKGTQFHPKVVAAFEQALRAGKLTLLSSQVLTPPTAYPLIWRAGGTAAASEPAANDTQLSA